MKTPILDFVPSHRMYGIRPKGHFAAYHAAPGWLFLEAGSWTLEVFHCITTTRRKGALAAMSMVLISALLARGFGILP